MTFLKPAILVGSLLALAALTACGPKEPGPRLVVVVATCTVNASYLGPYNPEVTTTPFLNTLAEKSLVFERHYTESGQSGVAFASIFSGAQADRHHIFYHPRRPRDELVWLPEIFEAAGYETHSWLAHPNASSLLNYAQGVAAERQHHRILEGALDEFAELLSELRMDPSHKAMVLSNFTVTHAPYGTRYSGRRSSQEFCRAYPGECDGKLADPQFWEDARSFHGANRRFSYDTETAMEAAGLRPEDMNRFGENIELLYRADVFLLDRVMEGIVSAIDEHGLLEESLIVFTADHGETMQANAAFPWTHAFLLTPEVIRAPLIIYGPGIAPGRYRSVTRSIDVLPTLAGLVGIEGQGENIAGVDLSAAIRGEEPSPALTARSHTSLWADSVWEEYQRYAGFHARFPERDPQLMWVSAVAGDRFYRLHRDLEGNWYPEAFDLARDALALRDVHDEADAEQRAMFVDLKSYHERLVHAYRSGADAPPLQPIAEEEILRALGYIE